MMDEAAIRSALEAGLPDARVQVSGDGTHFQAVIVSPAFEGRTLLQRHRLVNALLEDALHSGALHALSMDTLTPEQWAARQSRS